MSRCTAHFVFAYWVAISIVRLYPALCAPTSVLRIKVASPNAVRTKSPMEASP
jgi:hypothetical protein